MPSGSLIRLLTEAENRTSRVLPNPDNSSASDKGDVITTQDLLLYDMMGEDQHGNIIGRHRSTGIGRPRFWERARYFGEEQRLAAALDAAENKA